MKWDALGAIGEVVAAIAVIVTLLYLSRQIRHATNESRLSAIHDIAASYTTWLQSLAENEDLSRIWDAGLTDYESLDKDERVRFLLMMASAMRIMDDAYGQYGAKRMTEADWKVYESVLDLAAFSSGVSAYHSQRKSLHTPAFSKLLEEKISASEGLHKSLYR